MSAATFDFDNTYARSLPDAGVRWNPAPAPAPQLLYLNDALAAELGLDTAALRGDAGAALFAGNDLPAGAEPLAQVYAGHQFGGFSPRLGDGRALLLGELVDRQGRRRDIAFKGSGRTPYDEPARETWARMPARRAGDPPTRKWRPRSGPRRPRFRPPPTRPRRRGAAARRGESHSGGAARWA